MSLAAKQLVRLITLTLTLTGAAATGSLAQEPQAVVQGTVRDTAGEPLSEVQISVVGTGRKTFTDSAGRFRLNAVLPGRTSLRTGLLGYISAQQTVEIAPGARVTVDFAVRPSQLIIEMPVMSVPIDTARSR